MGQSLRQLKSRISGIQNTKKITRAMEMVSMAKLKPMQNKMYAFRNYFAHMENVLLNVLAGSKSTHNYLLDKKDKVKNILLCVVSSDTGLCGSYNYNLYKVVENFLSMNKDKKIQLVCIGKKSLTYFKRMDLNIVDSFLDMHGVYHENRADEICEYLMKKFTDGIYDEIYTAYTRFESAGYRNPVVKKFLNIDTTDFKIKQNDYILDPDRDTIIEELLPVYIYTKFRMTLFSAFASEHSARVMAMKEATDNAKEMLDNLILLRNKVRQANITGEIIEVISSADALKG